MPLDVAPDLVPLVLLGIATMAGAAVQAATGFGFAILAAPVFLAVLDTTAAVPILVALHVVQSAMLVPRVWRRVPWALFRGLAVGAVAGGALGLVLFHALEVRHLKLAVGVTVLLVAALLAVRRFAAASPTTVASSETGPERARSVVLVTGALSGLLTAVLVMPGPPLMVHLLRRPLPAIEARALSLTLFAACYVAVLAAHAATGSLDRAAWLTIGWLTGPVVAGTLAGLGLMRWLADKHFAFVLNILLVLAGVGAIASAFWGN